MRKMDTLVPCVKSVGGFDYGPKFMGKMLLMILNASLDKLSASSTSVGKIG